MTRAKTPANSGAWALAEIVVLLAALVCFVGAAAEAVALGSPHRISTPLLVAAAASFALGALVLIRVAVTIEHRFTSKLAVDSASAAARSGATRQPKNGPIARMVAVGFVVALLVYMSLLAVNLHTRAARSAYTQHHGLARAGTVQSVHSVDHATRYGSWTTYDYDVALVTKTGGANHTVVHDPTKNFQRFSAGEPLTALVDLQDPAYAELPDRPVESTTWFAGPLIIGIVFIAMASSITYEEVRYRRHRTAAPRTPAHSVRI